MAVPEPSDRLVSPAAREAARKRAYLNRLALEQRATVEVGAAAVDQADPAAERKRALLSAGSSQTAPDEAARKRALLRAPDAPATAPDEAGGLTRAQTLRATASARLRTYSRRQLAGALAGVVLLAGVTTYGVTRPPAPVPLTPRDVDQAVAKAIENERKAQAAKPPEGEAVYAAIRPSVVLITTDRNGDGKDDGSGAGTIVKDDGTILTALHVVLGSRVTVHFADGTTSAASVANIDPVHDIAVLTVERPPDLVIPAVLGGGVRVGDPVYAVGHPLGLTMSMSAGVVSATGRTLNPKETAPLKDMIQIDAAVNPGNSGGPLLNRNGQVVGVISALANPSESAYFIGIGFAAPITSAGGAAGAPPQ